MSSRRIAALLLTIGLLASGCGDGDSSADSGAQASGGGERSAATIRVPDDQPTIQAAVKAAEPGDLVLVAPGVYNESVTVDTDDIVIRGVDRNETILDGRHTDENGIKIFSNGVAVENLTARNYTANGVYWAGDYGNVLIEGYRASYLTTYNNGLYGVYAFNATKGRFEHSYGSGHPDSAFYIGQCNPCDALITDVVAERNMLGYSGTNSTGVTIVNSQWRDNRAGIVPNSLNSEQLAPNAGTTVVGNLVENNNATEAPLAESLAVAWGNGILVAGGSGSKVERNLVRGHRNGGIAITDLPDNFKPENNRVEGNKLSGNGIDLVYLTVKHASEAFGNCYTGNEFGSSIPENIERELTCDGTPGQGWDLSVILAKLVGGPPQFDYKQVTPPGPQTNMPDAATARAVPASKVDWKVDVAAITAPSGA